MFEYIFIKTFTVRYLFLIDIYIYAWPSFIFFFFFKTCCNNSLFFNYKSSGLYCMHNAGYLKENANRIMNSRVYTKYDTDRVNILIDKSIKP